MRPIADIRRENLARLVRDAGGPTRFAELMDPERVQSKKSQVQQWLMAPGTPNGRNLGSRTAREIEKIVGKPEGWLDTEHANDREYFSGAPSHLLRPDPETLHMALTLLRMDESKVFGGGPYRPVARAERIAELYEWVARDGGLLSDESNAEFLAQVEARRRAMGKPPYVRSKDGERAEPDEQRSAAASE